MSQIFISYRRDDRVAKALVVRLHGILQDHYGPGAVFVDSEEIPPGCDYRIHLAEQINQCEVVFMLMDDKTRWLGHRADGTRRIDEVGDPVRREIEVALARNIPLVPLLFDDAKMPSSAELPDVLKELEHRQTRSVSTGRDFAIHVQKLVVDLDRWYFRKASCSGNADSSTSRTVTRSDLRSAVGIIWSHHATGGMGLAWPYRARRFVTSARVARLVRDIRRDGGAVFVRYGTRQSDDLEINHAVADEAPADSHGNMGFGLVITRNHSLDIGELRPVQQTNPSGRRESVLYTLRRTNDGPHYPLDLEFIKHAEIRAANVTVPDQRPAVLVAHGQANLVDGAPVVDQDGYVMANLIVDRGRPPALCAVDEPRITQFIENCV